jgi:hypothetical protein
MHGNCFYKNFLKYIYNQCVTSLGLIKISPGSEVSQVKKDKDHIFSLICGR